MPKSSTLRTQDLVAVVDQLYLAALSADRWGDALARLNRAFSSDIALVFGRDNATSGPTFLVAEGPINVEYQRYASHYMSQDPRITRTEDYPVQRPVAEWQFLSTRDWHSKETYNEYARRFNVPFVMGATLAKSPRERMIFSLNRPGRAFTSDEMSRMSPLLPHLSRAARLSQRLGSLAGAAAGDLKALNRLPFGLVVVDSNCKVLEATYNATCMLRERDGIGLRDGVLILDTEANTAALHLAVKTCNSPLAHENANDQVLLAVHRAHHQLCDVYVVPCSSKSTLRSVALDAAALVFLFDSKAPPDHLANAASRFGFTPAETRVLALLLAGCSVVGIAEQLTLSVNTVRHLSKQLLHKAGARNQSALVRAVHVTLRSIHAPVLTR